MLKCFLTAAALACAPPCYPWHLMVGHQTPNGIAWEQTDSFLDGHECGEEAQRYTIAECVHDPQQT